MLGREVQSSNSQRNEICPNVTAGEAAHYCPSPARFCAASFSNTSLQQWTNYSSLYVFIDFEKAFDSLHRPSLWKILRHHGIQQKLVNIIQALFENFECQVIHNNQLTEPFRVDTGVKQGFILSPVLFSMAMDWLMRTVTQGRCQGIQWTLMTTLEDLHYADNIGLLSSKQQDAQQKA